MAGISVESIRTRDSAGCSRSWSSSNERLPGRTRTISPSATNGPSIRSWSIPTSSGKNRFIGRSPRLSSVISSPTETIVRNPSHFGS